MTESVLDPELLHKIIEFRRTEFGNRRSEFYRKLNEEAGINIGNLETLEKIFANGIKEGSVIFVPRRDGTGILNIDKEIKGKQVAQNFVIENKDEAAYLLGLQDTINKSKE